MSHKMDKDVSGAILCMFPERKRRECCIYYSIVEMRMLERIMDKTRNDHVRNQ